MEITQHGWRVIATCGCARGRRQWHQSDKSLDSQIIKSVLGNWQPLRPVIQALCLLPFEDCKGATLRFFIITRNTFN